MSAKRKLVTLLFTDIVGYSRMTQADERGTHALLQTHHKQIREAIKAHNGREVRTIGDAFFIEFFSAVSAVECAMAIRSRLDQVNQTLPAASQLILRQGIHLGDVLVGDHDEAYGNEVNIAARIQNLAPIDSICISEAVYQQVQNKLPFQFTHVGDFSLKNILGKTSIYSVTSKNDSKKKNMTSLAKGFFKQPASWSAVSLLVIMFLGLGLIVDTWIDHLNESNQPDVFITGNRLLNGNAEALNIEKDWEILINPGTNQNWESYQPLHRTVLSGRINGEYWLRKKIEVVAQYHEPSIVLGVIPVRQQLFVDGKWFGSQNHAQPVPLYPVPREWVKPGTHTLLVKAYAAAEINPGLNIVRSIGAWLGESSEIEIKVRRDWYSYHFPRMLYLGISIVFGLGLCLIFVFQTLRRDMLYYAAYALLGSMSLFYQNHLVSDGLSTVTLNVLKFFSVSLMSPILLSALFFKYQKPISENRNNFLAGLCFHIVAAFALFQPSVPISEILSRTNIFYYFSIAYSVSAAFYSFLSMIRNKHYLSNLLVTGVFCLVHAGYSYTALRFSSLPVLSPVLKDWVYLLFMIQPALFASGLTLHFLKKSASESKKGSRVDQSDEWIQFAIHSEQDVESLHKEWVKELKCHRSTLYWVSEDLNEALCLSHAPATHTPPFEKSTLREHPGLAWVVEQKRSIRLEHIPDEMKNQKFIGKYEGSSTMIITVLAGDRVEAILTFSDPIGRDSFDDIDFRSSQIVAQILYQKYTSQSQVQRFKKLRSVA
ncbi:MAG: hypothetical protein KA715_14375 [Xanthomonadaceae bacterium]|nr:hypothetical protein [Xanthomonadaceae bacterium]